MDEDRAQLKLAVEVVSPGGKLFERTADLDALARQKALLFSFLQLKQLQGLEPSESVVRRSLHFSLLFIAALYSCFLLLLFIPF